MTETEAAAIEAHNLFDLSTFLPKRPGDVELKVIKEMFEASVDGQPYDPDRWANYFKPSGFQGGTGSTGDDSEAKATPVAQSRPALASVPKAAPAAAADAPWEDDEGTAEASAPVATPAAKPASSQKAEDILAMIRNRQK